MRTAEVRQVLGGLMALWHLGGRAVVLAVVRGVRRGGPAGSFELTLVQRSGGWRVAGMLVY